MKYELSKKILADSVYIDSCIDLYTKLSNKYDEVTSTKITPEDYSNYVHELNPSVQMCIDTIYMISGWLAFGGVKEKSEYPKIRTAICNLSLYIAEGLE